MIAQAKTLVRHFRRRVSSSEPNPLPRAVSSLLPGDAMSHGSDILATVVEEF
jgi:hypothetical protein